MRRRETMKNRHVLTCALLCALLTAFPVGAPTGEPADSGVASALPSRDADLSSAKSFEDGREEPSVDDAAKNEGERSERTLVKFNVPIRLAHDPIAFESVFERDARPSDASPLASPATDVSSKELATEIYGRELLDFRLRSGNGKYMLEDDCGEIRIFPQSNIKSVEPAPSASVEELRGICERRLRDEFGASFRVKTTERFIFVSDASDGYVDWCGRLFEKLDEGFRLYARKSEIPLADRGEPLIVVIFSRQADFIRYASAETSAPDKLAAYYNMQTNRVALYDLSNAEGSGASNSSRRRKSKLTETREILSRPNADFNVATIIHEATHQLAFNRGVFLRTGPIALWAAEGMSLAFETPSGLATQGGWSFRGTFPKNERMINLFLLRVGEMKDPFRTIVAQTDFYKNLEGSYAASWALFYYLHKTKPRELAKYLIYAASKSPCSVYPPEDRIADFERFFGDDWERLTASVIRFVKRL